MTNFGPGQQEVMEVPSIVIRQVGAEELARENWRCKTYSQSVTNIAVELENEFTFIDQNEGTVNRGHIRVNYLNNSAK